MLRRRFGLLIAICVFAFAAIPASALATTYVGWSSVSIGSGLAQGNAGYYTSGGYLYFDHFKIHNTSGSTQTIYVQVYNSAAGHSEYYDGRSVKTGNFRYWTESTVNACDPNGYVRARCQGYWGSYVYF